MKLLQTLNIIRKTHTVSWAELTIIFAFFSALSFGQLGRVVWPVTFYLHDVVIFLWLLLKGQSTVVSLFKEVKQANWQKWWPLPAFTAWIALGMIIAFTQTSEVTPFLYAVRLSVYTLFLFSLRNQFKSSPLILRILLVCSISYMALFGLIQYMLIPDTRYLFLFGWDEHYYRLIGSLLDPNLSGILFTIGGWCVYSLRRVLPKKLWLGLLLILTAAIVLTYSRATYLASIVSIIAFWLLEVKNLIDTKRMLFSGLVVLFCLGVYILAPKPGGEGVDLLRTASVTARISSSREFLASLKPLEWITGAGFYTAIITGDAVTHARVPDNILVFILSSTGVIGFLLCFTAFTKLKPIITRWETEVVAAIIALFIHAQFNNSLLEPFVFLSIGITIISQKSLQTRSSKGDTRR